MSKQPRHVRDALQRLRHTLVLPQAQDPRQLWCLVRQEPMDGMQGCFFVTHGRNFDKFDKRKGFEVIGHSFSKADLAAAAHQATIACGESYQPKFSAHSKRVVEEEGEEAPDFNPINQGSIDPDDVV